MDILKGLNTQQQQAVSAGNGPVLVLAGPGSGKTRVLTHRIAYLIEHSKVNPNHIMAVTFTNKAAKEMEKREADLVGAKARGIFLGTFHAFCARLLRREAKHLPFTANYVIFDTDDQLTVVKRSLDDLNLDKKLYRPQSLLASISNAKNELIMVDDFPVQNYRDEVLKRVFERYQQLLLANNALDFDDLLLWSARLLEENSEVRESYSRWYEHVLVDEFQDTNLAQYLLVKMLSSFHLNIFVVGDMDQSIYAWRGADYRNLLRFEKDFPEVQIILLEQNYRSTQSILDVAMAVINRSPQRVPKNLFTERGEGAKIILRETYDDREEAIHVVDTIAGLIARQQAKLGDFAIMYRTNAQSRLLEEAFLHANLPYKLVGAQRFYGRREIKDIIAYLRLVFNPKDEISCGRVINTPNRGIGEKSLESLKAFSKRYNMTMGEMLLQFADEPSLQLGEHFSGKALISITHFAKLLSGWCSVVNAVAPLTLMDLILDDVGYHDYVDDGTDEGRDRWENIMELRRLASEYNGRSLQTFLEDIALISDQDTFDADAKVPTLLTLHSAKGLEFSRVFIIGLNEGTLPHIRSTDDPEDLEEERRLFYVGITRAKDFLYLIVPLNRSGFGYTEPVEESRFLEDIPTDLIEAPDTRYRSAKGQSSRLNKWESLASRAPQVSTLRFHAGSRVQHPVWGEGMVLNSRLQNDEEIVDVFFANVGLKRLAASLAKLELLPSTKDESGSASSSER